MSESEKIENFAWKLFGHSVKEYQDLAIQNGWTMEVVSNFLELPLDVQPSFKKVFVMLDNDGKINSVKIG